ncbi:MAG: hypothetical protein DCF29_02945 [Alphaproteobacteria bacterium]|nr:MAG: hypothetical protein DCF29_02945 [Alphaproteobacteria bacterium]
MAAGPQPADSTVRTLLSRLERRGMVVRSSDRPAVYRPAPQVRPMAERAMRDVIDTFYAGSAASAATALLGLSKPLTPQTAPSFSQRSKRWTTINHDNRAHSQRRPEVDAHRARRSHPGASPASPCGAQPGFRPPLDVPGPGGLRGDSRSAPAHQRGLAGAAARKGVGPAGCASDHRHAAHTRAGRGVDGEMVAAVAGLPRRPAPLRSGRRRDRGALDRGPLFAQALVPRGHAGHRRDVDGDASATGAPHSDAPGDQRGDPKPALLGRGAELDSDRPSDLGSPRLRAFGPGARTGPYARRRLGICRPRAGGGRP